MVFISGIRMYRWMYFQLLADNGYSLEDTIWWWNHLFWCGMSYGEECAGTLANANYDDPLGYDEDYDGDYDWVMIHIVVWDPALPYHPSM